MIQINTQFSDMAKLRSNPDADVSNAIHLLHRTIQCLISKQRHVARAFFENQV
ncbi:MAG: hypothetical protein V8T86_11880 [Victivallis sp.]